MWIVIDKSTQDVVGTCDFEPPAGAWDVSAYTVKEWSGAPPRLGSQDPTMETRQFRRETRFSTEDFEILDVSSESTTEQAALKVRHGGKIGWIHIHATR